METTEYDLGARRWHATGETLPDSVLAEIRQHDAILLGAVGDPGVPSGVLERGLLLRLRFELDHYVNLRPARLYPGVASPLAAPGEVDFVVVREGTEGPYVGNGGALRTGTPHEIATEVSVNTAFGVERVVRDAFRRAAAPPAAAADARAQAQRAHARRPPVAAHGRARQRRVPGRHDRLPARRRGDDLPGHRPVAVRRHRHRQPVRRHRHRPGRRHRRRHRAGGVRQRQPGPRPRRACSSRCTARPPTSPGSRRPTRRRPSCRSRCCSSTWAWTRPPPGSSRPSPPTSPTRDRPSTPAHGGGRRGDRRARRGLSAGSHGRGPRPLADRPRPQPPGGARGGDHAHAPLIPSSRVARVARATPTVGGRGGPCRR